MHFLYNMEEEDNADMAQSEQQMIESKVIQTQLWNPLIFAIFYGRQSIVNYLLNLGDDKDFQYKQQLAFLLHDPFKLHDNDQEPLKITIRQSLHQAVEQGVDNK